MSEYTGSYGAVNLNGSFNGWCGSCAEMTDDDADGVYELAIELDDEMSYEYKFTLDGGATKRSSLKVIHAPAPLTATPTDR